MYQQHFSMDDMKSYNFFFYINCQFKNIKNIFFIEQLKWKVTFEWIVKRKSISHAIQLNPFLTSDKDDIIIILRRNWVSLSPINVLRLESVGVVCACMQGRDVKKMVGISLFLGPGSIVKCIILFWKNWANYINPYIEVVLTLKLNLMLEQGQN